MRYNAVFTFLFVHLQMCVRMSKLEFFCNRPTIVALISFGLDISSGNKVTSDADTLKTSPERPLVKERTDEKGRVRGLLGFGKERVVFHLNMNMDSVTIFLNKEDGSQLAKLVQESFLMDLKVMTYFLIVGLIAFLSPLAFYS
jgi:vacuolar protein sorting-associated protein 13A/C